MIVVIPANVDGPVTLSWFRVPTDVSDEFTILLPRVVELTTSTPLIL